jgi:hypothetical protein
MRIKGYLDHIDLGVDKETGERSIIVHSSKEFATLPEAQQRCAWATIAIACEILETTLQGVYYRIYSGKIPTKIVKKNPTDLKGLALVKPYQSVQDRMARRKNDQHRLTKSMRRTLEGFTWLPRAQRDWLATIVSTELRHIETQLFGNEAKTNKGKKGKHEQHNK